MEEQDKEQKKSFKHTLYEFYEKKYKTLLIIPFIFLILALTQVGYQIATTGDFIKKDVSLKGGVTITVPFDKDVDIDKLEDQVSKQFPNNDVVARILRSTGSIAGVIVEVDIDGSDKAQLDALLDSIGASLNTDLSKLELGIEIIGSSLGASFFRESLIALAIAFLFMGLVVLIYFRTYIPSIAIVLAAFSDMVIALAVTNLLDIRIGTAGIAAFLMLIGYSVDTDILLTIRVLKRKEGTVMERIMSSMNTGLTMTGTAIVAVTVAMFVTQSEIIRQIMTILLIGLIADLFTTWLQNVGLLRIYVEKKAKKGIII
ncbi:preprotein translocase subunit SecF [Candidatus Woesearchaeota archaeon]|jgi:preprotein translocase subunit SecF|nr:preprotein translocase subunit SecF [Candidatus Woesearchaeota archaeon]|tara:strand:+ start:21896 stop:22840 length:945 start_codon:yes stop_codon:yes gene_type:complete